MDNVTSTLDLIENLLDDARADRPKEPCFERTTVDIEAERVEFLQPVGELAAC